jgi:hypothetical protein
LCRSLCCCSRVAAHLRHRIDVRLLDEALAYDGFDIGLRPAAFAGGIEVQALFQQFLRVGEVHQPELAADRIRPVVAFHHGDGAVGRDVDVMVGRLKHDGAAGAEYRIACNRDQLALVVDLQAAVAGIAFAARRLHHQKGGAVDGEIERILGLLARALGKVAEGAAVLDVADAAVAADEVVFVRARLQIFLEQRTVGLVARRVDVRDVVGNDIQLPFQRRLPRKSDEKRVLHRPFSPE